MAGLSILRALAAALALAGFSLADLGNELQNRQNGDPCAAIANQTYAVPSKVLACLKYLILLYFMITIITFLIAHSLTMRP